MTRPRDQESREGWQATFLSGTSRSHRVTIEESGESFVCDGLESVLGGLARSGRRGIPMGCRGGGCGVCKIEVLEGSFRKRAMSRSHVPEQDEARNKVLACCIFPESDMKVRVLGNMQRAMDGRKVVLESHTVGVSIAHVDGIGFEERASLAFAHKVDADPQTPRTIQKHSD